jgi:hypothetical protein
VTDPRAPAIFIKSVKDFTTMQTIVVIIMIRALRVNLFSLVVCRESWLLMEKLSIIENAAKIYTG